MTSLARTWHYRRTMNNIDQILNRVRKLLALAKNGSEHEAAIAAQRAAELMAEYRLSEALVSLDEPERPREACITANVDGMRVEPEQAVNQRRKKVAWRGAIASAVARSLGCRMYWWDNEIRAFGRESSCQAWSYTTQYLCREVDRLCAEAVQGADVPQDRRRAWSNAFRVGAAQRLAIRLAEQTKLKKDERAQAMAMARADAYDGASDDVDPRVGHRMSVAMTVVERDQREVEVEYDQFAKKKLRNARPIGQVSSSTGYAAGNRAGSALSLGGGRAGLGAGQGRLK